VDKKEKGTKVYCMNKIRKVILLIAAGILAAAGAVNASTDVTDDIQGSVTWTKANSPYHLKKQIYVVPGATLTMEAGTVVASLVKDQGSLAVCRGAKLYVMGTADEPVIMTSAEDVNNWAGSVCTYEFNMDPCHPNEWQVNSVVTMGNPKTGRWLARCNDWGNLTILGEGLISASHYKGAAVSYQDGEANAVHVNTKVPDGLNKKVMEGLTAKFAGDPNVLYGGANDDDDSGEIHYLSLRYGGKVIGLANELNGLSLGALGRETEIDHVEIMNNVDDGIEVWGGTVNLKYISIWNVGDDSLDCDEGWRGKTQFGLIVQGYSVGAAQGSGVGDNCLEMDGAEDSDAQPCTTSAIYNYTVIGQPISGDHGTAWRDNAHIQYRNCIFMDLGELLVKNDANDGDGAIGYGYNGTLSFANTWLTNYMYRSTVNEGTWTPGAFNDPNVLYTIQVDGNLAEIADSVFCRNLHASAYTEATNRGVFDPSKNNVTSDTNHLPIQMLVRGPVQLVYTGLYMMPVIAINPCPANDAVTSVNTAPDDGFFTPANFRGGFAPNGNWLAGWTAASAYGITDTSTSGPAGDLNYDNAVDFFDLSILCDNWLL
jgi:hypothetical protein